LGGEKLKLFHFFAGLALCLVCASIPLYAQVSDPQGTGGEVSPDAGAVESPAVPAPAPRPDESLMLFDDDTGGTETPAPAGSGVSTVFPFLRMLLVLALAAAAVYGLVYFFKRLSRPQAVQDAYLKVLTTVHLGTNRYIHVVSLGSKAYLVGSGDSGVSLIAELDDQETIDAMLLEAGRKAAESGGPLDFKKLLRRFSGSGSGPEVEIPRADSITKRREKFRGLR
jgi:flagellar protein FliO/FliZ